jgi:RNA polymerase sigma-70 factor (TIGR02943 family)
MGRSDAEVSVSLPECDAKPWNQGPGDEPRRDSCSISQTAGKQTIAPRTCPEQWLQRHGDALFRYAMLLAADEHIAEDLVQETLLAALKAHNRFEEAASERTWLVAILRHKTIDHFRRGRREEGCLPVQVDPVVEGNFNLLGKWRKPPSRWVPSPQSLLESQEFWAIFRACMRTLPFNLREAFALHAVEGLEAKQTCRVLKISDKNLWTMMFRARERLRRCLEAKWLKNGKD